MYISFLNRHGPTFLRISITMLLDYRGKMLPNRLLKKWWLHIVSKIMFEKQAIMEK
jgi:hypothetical protein